MKSEDVFYDAVKQIGRGMENAMKTEGVFYNAVKQIGKGAGAAGKALISSKNIVFKTNTFPDAESIRVEILKEKKEGELTILSIDGLRKLFKSGCIS